MPIEVNATNAALYSQSCDMLVGVGSLTISAWVRITDLSAERVVYTSHGGKFYLYITTAGKVAFDVSVAAYECSASTANGTISINQYYHIACTWNSNPASCVIYIDGSASSSPTVSDVIEPMTENGIHYIAGDTAGKTIRGFIEAFGMWSRVLSAAEIESMAKLRIRPLHPALSSGLLLYLPLNGSIVAAVINGDIPIKNHSASQPVTAFLKVGTIIYRPATSPGLNLLYDDIKIGRPDYFPHGCHRIYRSKSQTGTNAEHLRSVSQEASQVMIQNQTLAAGETWNYFAQAVSPYGDVSALSPACVVAITDEGEMKEAVGNPPTSLAAEPAAEGTVKVSWSYSTIGEDASPDGFSIYSGLPGDLTLLGTKAYVYGRPKFAWTSAALTGGVPVRITVRTYKGTTEEENNTGVWVTPDDTGPPANDTAPILELA